MTWLWLALVGWLSLAVVAAALIGIGIRLADRRDRINGAPPLPPTPASADRLLVAPAGGHRAS